MCCADAAQPGSVAARLPAMTAPGESEERGAHRQPPQLVSNSGLSERCYASAATLWNEEEAGERARDTDIGKE